MANCPANDNLGVLAAALEQACVELMAGYGVRATVQPAENQTHPPGSPMVAAVDFSSHQVRGTVTFRASQSVIAQTARGAAGMTADPNGFLADWTCELTNQLVGRMKSKLRAYDLTFNVNVPRLLASQNGGELEHGIRYRFVCESGSFSGYLDVLIQPGFLLEHNPSAVDSVAEGELVIL
ncbi:MAG TPA: chemotaxis protein CheX [Polyangiaceae bacterium]|jgi:hypothetical protein